MVRHPVRKALRDNVEVHAIDGCREHRCAPSLMACRRVAGHRQDLLLEADGALQHWPGNEITVITARRSPVAQPSDSGTTSTASRWYRRRHRTNGSNTLGCVVANQMTASKSCGSSTGEKKFAAAADAGSKVAPMARMGIG
jgi:hypothetical protein